MLRHNVIILSGHTVYRKKMNVAMVYGLPEVQNLQFALAFKHISPGTWPLAAFNFNGDNT
jgi:hypothetical protein